MNDRFARLGDLFSQALALDTDARRTFLDRECGDDSSLRGEIERLLDSSSRTEDFLERSALHYLPDQAPIDLDGEAAAAFELAGKTLGNHQLVELIGIGGMGAVYRARNLTLGRREALKILFPHLAGSTTSLRRFKREARAVAALNHPGIAQIYESGEAEGLHFIAMELVEGTTLASLLQESRLSPAKATRIAAQLLEALSAAHRTGIIHRDIKSSNIVVRPDGVVKILDFGLAKIADFGDRDSLIDLSDVSLTAPGTVMGTVSYMSPEQIRRDRLDQRTDLFSFGVVFYEMLTGELPFQGRTAAEIIDKICRANPLPVARVNTEVSPKLEVLIRKCLAKDRSLRYPTANSVLSELTGSPRPSAQSGHWWSRLIRRWR